MRRTKKSDTASRHQEIAEAAEALLGPSLQSTWIAIGIAVVGTTVSVVGAVAAGQAQKKAANYNAAIASQKATIAQQQASEQEDAQRRHAAQVLGQEAAGAADSGTGLGGTNAKVFGQSATNAELDALNIRYQGKLGRISGDEEAAGDIQQGKDAVTASYFNAGAAALSGTSRAYGYKSDYDRYRKQFASSDLSNTRRGSGD